MESYESIRERFPLFSNDNGHELRRQRVVRLVIEDPILQQATKIDSRSREELNRFELRIEGNSISLDLIVCLSSELCEDKEKPSLMADCGSAAQSPFVNNPGQFCDPESPLVKEEPAGFDAEIDRSSYKDLWTDRNDQLGLPGAEDRSKVNQTEIPGSVAVGPETSVVLDESNMLMLAEIADALLCSDQTDEIQDKLVKLEKRWMVEAVSRYN